MDFNDFLNSPTWGSHEPGANWLGIAQDNFEVFTAHLKTGFSVDQAIQLTAVYFTTMMGHVINEAGKGDNDG